MKKFRVGHFIHCGLPYDEKSDERYCLSEYRTVIAPSCFLQTNRDGVVEPPNGKARGKIAYSFQA